MSSVDEIGRQELAAWAAYRGRRGSEARQRWHEIVDEINGRGDAAEIWQWIATTQREGSA